MQQHIFSSAVHCIYLKYTCRWDTKIFLTPEFCLFFLTKLTNFLIVKDCKCICVITNLHNYRHVFTVCVSHKNHLFLLVGTPASSKMMSTTVSRSSPLSFSGSPTMATHSHLIYCSCSANLCSICTTLDSKSSLTLEVTLLLGQSSQVPWGS